jgi:hypothetical protein
MLGLFMWRCCGLGFLALHKLQFSVEFCISTIFSICCSVLECKGPAESWRLILSHFKLSRDQSEVPVKFSEAEYIRSCSC